MADCLSLALGHTPARRLRTLQTILERGPTREFVPLAASHIVQAAQREGEFAPLEQAMSKDAPECVIDAVIQLRYDALFWTRFRRASLGDVRLLVELLSSYDSEKPLGKAA